MGVVLRKIYLLPIIIFLGFPLTFLVTYIIAMKSKDIVPFMPYVSDTGTYSPESCIFGQMLNTGAILMATTMYVRFRHVNEVLKLHHLPESLGKANKIGLWLGITATAGVGLVGNFQETNVFSVHLLGAALAFGLGTVYQVIQTLISLRMFPKIGSTYVNYARIVISLSCCVSSTITLVFGGLSLLAFDGEDITKWTPDIGGYKAHVTSAIAEWITVMLTMAYILTISYEFKTISLYEPEIELEPIQSKTSFDISRY